MRTKDFKKKIQQQMEMENKKKKRSIILMEGCTSVVKGTEHTAYVNWGSSSIPNSEKLYTCECLQDIGLEDLVQGEKLMLSKLCDAVVDLKVSTIEHNSIYINLI